MSGPELLIGGRYRLVEQIATGGMGSVWEAWDERLQRRVALKQLHPQPGLSRSDAELASSRAMREARITARLHHAHAVPVYDVVDHDGMPCLVMQYLPSRSLQSVLAERGTLGVAEVARIGSEVAGALAAAHQVGIVHRDVKPGNVLIDADGAAKLTDFGISHALGDVSLTSTGMVTGTPAFLAPEVARGIESGFAADVFSLGSTLYAAIEGTPPFGTADNPMATLHRVASGHIRPPQRSGPLTPVLQRMLATDPRARPSMEQVAAELAAVQAAATDPAVVGPTQRMDRPAPPPAGPPPSTTMNLPPAGPPTTRPSHTGRNALIALAVAALVALGIVLATQLGQGSGNTAQSGTTAAHTTASAHGTSHTASQSAPQSAPNTQSRGPSSAPNTASGGGGGPTAAQQEQAVADYYALLPDDTKDAWQRLTPEYQHGAQAGGRGSYDNFWKSVKSVSAGNERMSGGLVLADLSYVYDNGKTATETRSFRLVEQGGTLKIADSQLVG